MVIGFNKQFVSKIKKGTKIHTIREDKHDRWKAGMTMHMATGVRTKKYKQFRRLTCVSTQKIQIIYYDNIVEQYAEVFVDGKKLTHEQLHRLILNDGFESSKDFFKWFNKNYKGKIIHWTLEKY